MKEKDIFEIEVDGEMKDMEELASSDHTTLYAEKDFKYNAPHTFAILESNLAVEKTDEVDEDGNLCCEAEGFATLIHFQEGPIKEVGVYGVSNEDLIIMVVCRLDHFQNSAYKCEENAKAIEHLNAALDALSERTNKRNVRCVEGTSAI